MQLSFSLPLEENTFWLSSEFFLNPLCNLLSARSISGPNIIPSFVIEDVE